MKIEVYSDMVCPWCRIGKKNMSDALAQWEQQAGETVPVSYRAYQLDPNLPPEGKPFRQNMEAKMGGADRLQPMLQRVTDAGAEIGVTFRFDQVDSMPNTLLAHRITKLLPADRQGQWVDTAMAAYFEQGRNIADMEMLLELAAGMGLDAEDLRKRLEAGEGTSEVQQDFDSAKAIGITGVPFFLINDKYALSGASPASQFLAAFRKIAQEPPQA
ncbi:MAG: DsbA family oxidoreductase [Cohnella sp.]|nr:DsbA family oxidoreductase [Cohnella sp.]